MIAFLLILKPPCGVPPMSTVEPDSSRGSETVRSRLLPTTSRKFSAATSTPARNSTETSVPYLADTAASKSGTISFRLEFSGSVTTSDDIDVMSISPPLCALTWSPVTWSVTEPHWNVTPCDGTSVAKRHHDCEIRKVAEPLISSPAAACNCDEVQSATSGSDAVRAAFDPEPSTVQAITPVAVICGKSRP